jgi:hypothetical protein
MTIPAWCDTCGKEENWFGSANLAATIQLGLDELSVIRGMMSPLIARTAEPELPVMETAAACTMLHSFYTEIEKILQLIALDIDKRVPSSESWHRDLLNQMAGATGRRPAVISADLVAPLAELLASRHLFRGASIVLMRWNKLSPLMAKVDGIHEEVVDELTRFQFFLRSDPPDTAKP